MLINNLEDTLNVENKEAAGSKLYAVKVKSVACLLDKRFVLYNFGKRIEKLEDDISKLIGFPKSYRLVTEINQLADELRNELIPKKYRSKYSMIYLDKDVGSTILVDKGFFKNKLTVSVARDNSIHEYQFIRKSSKDIKEFSHNTYVYDGTVQELFNGETIPALLSHESYTQTKYS